MLVTDMPAWFVAAFSEAGFCWGGNWIQVKDAMHYSWSGPVLTPGYGPRPAPYPPVTDAAPFPPGTTVTTVLPDDPEASFFLADLSGDGAPDLVRVRPVGGGVRVEAAGSPSFDRIGFRADVPVPAGRELLMADHDGDGRADLWVLDDADGTLSVEVRSHRSRYREVIAAWSTAIPAADDYGLTHGDDDFAVDLVTLDRDGPATIWSQRSGFADPVTTLTPDRSGLGSVSWAPALGDWDVDGRTDLYLVVKGDPAEVRVVTATGSRTTIPLGGAVPVAARLLLADYDGDGRDDLYLLHDDRLEVRLGGARGSGESLTSWFESVNEVPWDAGPECPTGAVCASVGFVDDLGRWHLAEFPGADHDTDVFYYGNPDDVPFMGDWDCDGIDTPGLYRRSDGYVYLRDANTEGVADRSFYFGNPGDVPLVGDFDGDGCDTVSIYRPSEHRFYLVDRLGDGDEGLGEADRVFTFGDPGDVPFVGDFDGDGRDDVGLHRVSTGRVYLRLEQTDGVADVEFVYGDPGDTVVAGDWDGDGVDTVGVYRPSEGTWYLNLENRSGVADHVVHFHAHEPRETIPVVGSFRVGD
ncbi:MAG TPA: M15 family peptidase [Actinobacteria bacterium]|nr:M15 family peptidase [Actinomycetota bacterium]